jgi:carbon monoxide dehydrogenase subunit G
VWAAFLDPETLASAIPGCDKLESIGPDEYKAVMKVGVGPIKGTFEGKVRLFDQEPPARYRMAVEGTGAPGFVRGEAAMHLEEAGSATRVRYDADVQVGGLIASVGQRMLGGAARLILDQFFGKMAELLAKRP